MTNIKAVDVSEIEKLIKETRELLYKVSGSALLAGEKCKKEDKGILYKLVCEANNNLSYCQSLLDRSPSVSDDVVSVEYVELLLNKCGATIFKTIDVCHVSDGDILITQDGLLSVIADYLSANQGSDKAPSTTMQDDVRKDAERWRYLKDKYAMVNFDIYDAEMGETKVTGIIFEMPSGIRYSADINATIDQAIDKARE